MVSGLEFVLVLVRGFFSRDFLFRGFKLVILAMELVYRCVLFGLFGVYKFKKFIVNIKKLGYLILRKFRFMVFFKMLEVW